MKPDFKLIVNGRDITSDVVSRGVIVEWSDTVDEGSDSLRITVADHDNLVAVPKVGTKVELSAGYDGALYKVGTFYVEEAEISGPPDQVGIQATSAPVAGTSGSIADRKSKSWENVTLGDVAKTLAEQLGVTASVAPALASIQIVNEQQVDQSDTDFLIRLVRRYGGFLKFAQGKMVVAEEGAGTSTGGKSVTVALTRSDLTNWSVTAGGKLESFKKVKMKAHDYKTGQTTEVEVEVPKSGSMDQFGVSQAGSGTFTPKTFIGPNPYATPADAAKAAQTTAKRIARASRKLNLSMPGRLDIVAGGKIALSDIREGVNGSWLAKTIQHRIDSGGWSMTVSGEGA